ncbi:MAG: hypothetical protein M1428_02315 [Deltaproteobacteria bacterium]|nr:hypothetical protein [Deltaproteobacteria bacterium]
MAKKISELGQDKVVIYRSKYGHAEIEVKLEKDTLWLTQSQIASLFGTQRPAITKHLNNIFKSGELDKESVCSIWNVLPLTVKSIGRNTIVALSLLVASSSPNEKETMINIITNLLKG